jgi:hypothetical protein
MTRVYSFDGVEKAALGRWFLRFDEKEGRFISNRKEYFPND